MNPALISRIEKENREELLICKSRQRWIWALYVCSIGGFSGGLLGLFLSGLAFFGFVENAEAVNRIGTWLIVVAFPLIMVGAYAIDKITEIEKKEKRRSFEEEQKRGTYSPEKWKE